MPHLSHDDLQHRLNDAALRVQLHGRYRHYKGGEYIVHDIALRESDCQPCVIYEATHSPGLRFIRDIDDWTSTVDHDGTAVARFSLIN